MELCQRSKLLHRFQQWNQIDSRSTMTRLSWQGRGVERRAENKKIRPRLTEELKPGDQYGIVRKLNEDNPEAAKLSRISDHEKNGFEEDKTTSMSDTELSKLITELCHDEL